MSRSQSPTLQQKSTAAQTPSNTTDAAVPSAYSHWEAINTYLEERHEEAIRAGTDASMNDYNRRLAARNVVADAIKALDGDALTDTNTMINTLHTHASAAKSWTVTFTGGLLGSKRFTNLLNHMARALQRGEFTVESLKDDLVRFDTDLADKKAAEAEQKALKEASETNVVKLKH